MEVSSFSSDVVALRKVMASSVVKAVVFESVLAAQRSILCLLLLTGCLLKDVDSIPELIPSDKRFPLDELHTVRKSEPENKDASDTEDDDEDDDADDDQDDDAGDEDFSGEEGGDDDDVDPEDDPEANGNGGSDDEDEDDDDGEEDEDGEDEDEDDEEEDEDEEDQPPAKKRK